MNGPDSYGYIKFMIQSGPHMWNAELRVWDAKNFGPASPGTHRNKFVKIAIRGDGKSPDQKVIDMQLQAANLVYIFDVIILSVTANKSGRTSFPL